MNFMWLFNNKKVIYDTQFICLVASLKCWLISPVLQKNLILKYNNFTLWKNQQNVPNPMILI